MNTIEKLKKVNTMSAEAIALIKKLQSEEMNYILLDENFEAVNKNVIFHDYYKAKELADKINAKICIIL